MIKAILTDIEGTTTSISFVVDVLFPFARARIADFVIEHQHDAVVAEQLQTVRSEIGKPQASLEEVIGTLIGWIDADRKITPLKALQGMIWASGYASGELLGHVYDDVPGCLEQWKSAGLTLAVYSSGSIAAQKLIFGHTRFGDLTPLFSAYFDTTTGGKREAASYSKIADALGFAPGEILFLSDIQQELDAAQQAGLRTVGLERGERDVVKGHVAVSDFSEIELA